MKTIASKISDRAKELGFDIIGFTPAKIDEEDLKYFKNWLRKGYEGDMGYMKKISPRKDLKKILPSAKSVIVLGINYFYSQSPLKKGYGRIARYAFGRDYHKAIGKKLKELVKFIKEIAPKSENKFYLDTGPILERSLAVQAGLGNIGKNTCLITPRFGSWIFLAEIITSLEFDKYDKRILPDPATAGLKNYFPLCGNCQKCIQACPTGALIAPGIIDARRCISYLTIENKKQIPKKLLPILKKERRLFGCDICQEVCPHNIARQKTREQSSPIAGNQLSIKKILSIRTDAQFLKTFANSPLMRTKRKGLQGTASVLR